MITFFIWVIDFKFTCIFFKLSTALLYIDFSTSILVGALHDWPEFLKHLKAPLSIASSSASLNNTCSLSPNSKLNLLKSFAAFCDIKAPALVDPVKISYLHQDDS